MSNTLLLMVILPRVSTDVCRVPYDTDTDRNFKNADATAIDDARRLKKHALKAGPGGCCPPRHRMPFK
jgi:hypothetical protein